VYAANAVLEAAGYVSWGHDKRKGATVHLPCYEVDYAFPWPKGYTKYGTPRKERPMPKAGYRRAEIELHRWQVRSAGPGCWAVRGHVDAETLVEEVQAYTGAEIGEPTRVLHEYWRWSPKVRVYIEMPTGKGRGTFAVTVGEWDAE